MQPPDANAICRLINLIELYYFWCVCVCVLGRLGSVLFGAGVGGDQTNTVWWTVCVCVCVHPQDSLDPSTIIFLFETIILVHRPSQ